MDGMGWNEAVPVVLADSRGISVPDHSSALKEAKRSENGICTGKNEHRSLRVTGLSLYAGVVESVYKFMCLRFNSMI